MENWYLLYSKPKQEARAQQHLANQGFESFVPHIHISKIRAGKTSTKAEPLFPRYIFLKADSDINLGAIRSTRGVAGFVKFGQTLATVPAELIRALLTRQIQLQQEAPEHIFKPGQQLDVLAGPFASLNAVFQQADGDSRSIILVNFLGQQVKLAINNKDLAVTPSVSSN
ncbi:transcription/translation regulatory transformer protein RfaH [Alishewanella sp. 16-MA]|uniref:Transcription/translation regulatory transformer protein RfaH n=1 Tax=Alishewanella maricola TaxID=2795740 RepID=A0ABS8C178_9ALTE|nr:transcription/translation regulatory transformer protein RfaH [Alishewanella maricola]MCB5226079.1 transcription/translation regulatory transformer protein RfaH [Alishewanella maricola]